MRHIKTVHDGEKESHACEFCGKNLSTHQRLISHIKSVHGLKDNEEVINAVFVNENGEEFNVKLEDVQMGQFKEVVIGDDLNQQADDTDTKIEI